MTSNKFLIGSFIVCLAGYFFGWFQGVEDLSTFGFLLGWFSLYKLIENKEIFNQNMDQIEKRLYELENDKLPK